MPRASRAVLPGYPHHVVQRGHDGQAVFITDDDFRHYLANLAECSVSHDVRVLAFCLMTNHVHLLLAPTSAAGLGLLMKQTAGNQTSYRNRLEGRRGTLWEGRYRSSIVDIDKYLHACIRYIELNPVRAAMHADPADYAWSSYRGHAGLESLPWLVPIGGAGHDHAAYVHHGLDTHEMDLIREAVSRSQLTGSKRFTDQVERSLGRRIERRGPGRPSG